MNLWILYADGEGNPQRKPERSDGEDLNIHEEAPIGTHPTKGTKEFLMSVYDLYEEDLEASSCFRFEV